MKTIGDQVKAGELPVFPTTYAEAVVAHGDKRRRRGRNPSQGFLGENNPRKALQLAKGTLSSPEGVLRDRLLRLSDFLPGAHETTYQFGAYLAERVNSELVPQGFIMAAQLALHDLQTGVDGLTGKPLKNDLARLPPIMFDVISFSIPQIAKAIFPADFADHVKTSVDNIHQRVREQQEAERAALPPPMIDGDPLVIYAAARRIADLAFDFYEPMGGEYKCGQATLDDYRTESVNPYYHQTTGGLFLEVSGIPNKIWTPWGQWQCWGSGSYSTDCNPLQQFLDSIGKLELFAEQLPSRFGEIGPIYSVLQVGDVVLPKPKLREGLYFEYKESHRLWEEVVAQHAAQQ